MVSCFFCCILGIAEDEGNESSRPTPMIRRNWFLFFHIIINLWFNMLKSNFHIYPSREVRAGSDRKAPEIDGKWKQESFGRIRRPDLSGFARNRNEPDKSSHRFRSKDSCFHFRHFPAGTGVFPVGSHRKRRLSGKIRLRESFSWVIFHCIFLLVEIS